MSILERSLPTCRSTNAEWIRGRVHNGFWNVRAHREAYLNWLERELGFSKNEQWYEVRIRQVKSRGFSGFLKKYGNSLQAALADLRPDYRWEPWRFANVSQGYWMQPSNSRQFLRALADGPLQIVRQEQWLAVPVNAVGKHGGEGLLQLYGHSLRRTLTALYPQAALWKAWQFSRCPPHFWSFADHCRDFLLSLGQRTDWRHMTLLQLRKLGGGGLLNGHGHSFRRVLLRAFPECFSLGPVHPRFSIELLESRLAIASPSEWLQVAQPHLRRLGAGSLLSTVPVNGDSAIRLPFGKLAEYLRTSYPQGRWHVEDFFQRTLKSQCLLYRRVRTLFASLPIELHFNAQVRLPQQVRPLQLDVWLPDLHLALEYHGIQHYESTSFYGSTNRQQLFDKRKRDLCTAAGITLVEIGHWWPFDEDTLLCCIHRHRPDLLAHHFL